MHHNTTKGGPRQSHGHNAQKLVELDLWFWR